MEVIDKRNMEYALELARKAYEHDEVPIGAIVVDKNNRIIGKGFNTREKTQNAINHAEIIAIQEASHHLRSWRLEDCTLYVTLEPCPMCSGAIIQSRIARVVYGAKDPKGGTVDSILHLLTDYPFNHHPDVTSGILEEDCGEILRLFFRELRMRQKEKVQSEI